MHEIPGQQRLNFNQAVRDSLIDGLRLPARQAHFLKTLDRLMRDEHGEPNMYALKDDVGNVTIELVLLALSVAMTCSIDTVRRAYRQLGATPYLSVEAVDGRPHLFTMHWPAIIDDARPNPALPAVPVLNREKGVAAKVARGSTDFARGSNAATPPGGVAAHSALHDHAIQRSEEQLHATAARCHPSQNAATPRSRTGWEVATEQLRDLSVVEGILVPRAISTFRLTDSEATRDGILAAACRAVSEGNDPPKLFTFLVKRRAWECSGRDGLAEKYFDQVRSWRRQQEQLPRQEETLDGYHAALSADAEFEARRAEQLARLRQAGLGGVS